MLIKVIKIPSLNHLRDRAQKMTLTDKKYFIGIDPGVSTGLAVWDVIKKKFFEIRTTSIHKAMEDVKQYHKEYSVTVRVEDARKRKWFGNAGREELQGAGSIKRDCKIWEDFLSDNGIEFEMVAPKNNKTKLDAARFSLFTKWEKSTNEHSRDAAMLVYGF